MKKQLLTLIAASWMFSGFSQTVSFSYTGDLDSLIIPNCVDSVIINVWGAQGESPISGGIGGKGAFATGRLDVTAGDKLYIQVGGQNGYNGGGMGGQNGDIDYVGTNHGGYGGYGGGASDVRFGGLTLGDRIIVAGGGGGGGHNGVWPGCPFAAPAGDGGHGSGIDGTAGVSFDCACGGGGGQGGLTATTSAGGTGGGTNSGSCGVIGTNGGDGSLGIGGDGHTNFYLGDGGAGGGGGGYYGGGAGGNGYNTTPGGGGGGGSSYTGSLNNANIVAGVRNGNGQITITYILSSPIMTTAVGQSDITLNSLQAGVSYQWLNCGTGYSVIAGATNQAFTATSNGSYAVELDNGNGCVDTSACFTITQVGLEENTASVVQVYPNPMTDFVNVSLPVVFETINVVVYDVDGRAVISTIESGQSFSLNTQTLAPGVYLMKLSDETGIISTHQLVKK